MRNPFRMFKQTSPGIIRLAVMIDIRLPLSLRPVEDPLHKRGVDIRHETVRAPDLNLRQFPDPWDKFPDMRI